MNNASSLWKVLCNQSGMGVAVYDALGICRYMNIQARQIYLGNNEDPANRSLEELEGKSLATERMSVITRVLSTGNPAALRQIYGGRSIEVTIWNTGESQNGTPLVLSITRYVSSSEPSAANSIPVVESQYLDLGALACLSDKELMVLILIGEGLPLKRIASQLGTPIRTIENRRSSLGRKLGADSLVSVGILAHSSGLEQRHATLTRVIRRRLDEPHPSIGKPSNGAKDVDSIQVDSVGPEGPCSKPFTE